MKSNQEIAKEIFQGKWGDNLERKRRLIEAGYDYDKVMSIVNAIASELPMEEILKRAEEYDREHGIVTDENDLVPIDENYLVPIEINGTETLEITVDLNKYNSIQLTFVSGDNNG